MRRALTPFLLLSFSGAPAHAATFTATEMMKLKRLSDPSVSPDGKWVVYAVTEVDLDPFILSGGAAYCMTLRLDRTSQPGTRLIAAE